MAERSIKSDGHGSNKLIVGELDFRGELVTGTVQLEQHAYDWKVGGQAVYNPAGPTLPKVGAIWQGKLGTMRIQVTVMPDKASAPGYVRDCEELHKALGNEKNPVIRNGLLDALSKFFNGTKESGVVGIMERYGVNVLTPNTPE